MSPVELALPKWRDAVAQERIVDILAVLVAAALPWSTSLVAIFVVGWLIVLSFTLDFRSLILVLRRPVCALPIMLFALAVLGTLWSAAPWSTRLHAVSPAAKLLVLPLLIYHFERSTRGTWVFLAFLASCTALLAMSWVVVIEPRLTIKPVVEFGIPVKNYIDQSQEFALCAVALLYPIVKLMGQKKFLAGALLVALSLTFLFNMAYVVVSRTALFTTPVMLFVLALHQMKLRGVIITIGMATMLASTIWFTSPSLRGRTYSVFSEYNRYELSNEPTSVGLRLEFWRKSLHFLSESPLFGHGTGSTSGLFAHAAIGQTGAAAEVVANPHNQTLNVAIQWGALGVVVLYAMWLAHLLLFRGSDLGSSIGLLVVTQNFVTSLFNSHLFDFHEGWMYVLGVGVAGGMVLGTSSREAALCTRNSAKP
jgi:O-antigen ligase